MTGRYLQRAVTTLLALTVLTVCGAGAQAICSAPHSSPTLSRAGIGIQQPGSGWLQVTGYHTRSDAFFGPDGRSRPFLSEGQATTSSVYISAAGGLLRGVEVWVQVPVHQIEFADETGSTSRIGIGDPRISARIGGALFGLETLPISVRAGLKLPGSEFPVDPDVLPISEGQADFEVALEAGLVLAGTYPLHVVGWAGYRWRLENQDRGRKPGDERIARLGVGGPAGELRWDLAMEGLWGVAPEQQGLLLEGARRRLVQVLPTIGWSLGAAELELTGRISVSGRNLPTGPSLSVGALLPWSLR